MKFAHPEMLLLIWLAPLLLAVFAFGMRKRRRILKRYASAKGLKAIVPNVSPGRRRIKAGLILAAVVCIVLALAGPQYGYHWQETERRGIDIVIALDCSRSMLAEDIAPSRLDRAKREVIDLLGMLQGDRVGLTAFAGAAFLQCPLTIDYTVFNLFLNSLTPESIPVGGTNLAEAVNVSRDAFKTEDNSAKAIILITDGESTVGDISKASKEAAKDNIKIFCIGVGKEGGAPVPDKAGGLKKDAAGKIIMTKLDETTLQKIAAITSGAYVRSVTGDMDLDTIYRDEIRGKMDARTLTTGRQKIGEDRFQWFLIVAIVLFLSELFLPTARKTAATFFVLSMILVITPETQAASVHANLKTGQEAFTQGDYETALKHFIDAQLDNPDNPKIAYNIGNTYYKLGDYEAAFKSYESALKSEDAQIRLKALYNTGNTHFRQEKYKEALASYEKALELDKDDLQAGKNIEFVKKVMAQKKQQQQEQNKSDADKKKSDKEKKDESDNKKNSQSKDDPSKKPDDKKKSSSEKDDHQKKDAAPPNKPPESEDSEDKDKKDAQNPEEEKAQQAANPKSGKPDKDAKKDAKQAQQALNRLKDQPGRAMMPVSPSRVEKDW
jgi:Ca-activated chloride channel family protein